MRQRRLLVAASAFVLGILAYLLSSMIQPPLAHAHAYVIGSDPVDGITLNTVPNTIRIYFNAPVSAMSSVQIYSVQQGNFVDVTAGPSSVSIRNPRELDTPLKNPSSLPQGSYSVKWTAISNDDGHVTYGLIGFNVGYSGVGLPIIPKLGPSTSNNVEGVHELNFISILSIIWDWLILLGITFWIGILTIERVAFSSSRHIPELLERARKQAIPLQWLCLTVIFLGEIVTLILRVTRITQVQSSNGIDPVVLARLLTQSNYGMLWLVRITLIFLAMGLLYWTTSKNIAPPPPTAQKIQTRTGSLRPKTTQDLRTTTGTLSLTKERLELVEVPPVISVPQSYTPIWLSIAALIILTRALSGEGGLIAQPHISALIFDWLAQAALGLWLGSLAYLGYILIPLISVIEKDHTAETLSALVRHLTPLLTGALCVFLISNLFLKEVNISDSQQLISDPYGRILIVQFSVLTVLVFLSVYAMFLRRPKLTRQILMLPVVNAELPRRRTRQSAIEQSERRLKQIVTLHSWLGGSLLFCSALMAFYAAPITFPALSYPNTSSQVNTSQSHTQTKLVGDLTAMFQVLPARADAANTIIITLNDRTGKPVSDAQIGISINMRLMDMGTTQVTIKEGNPVYLVSIDKGKAFSMAGPWTINVTIQRPGQTPLLTSFELTVSQAD